MLLLSLCCLIVNEIAHAPNPGASEYVELLNTGTEAIDLSLVSFYDARGGGRAIVSRPTLLPAGEFVVLVQNGQAFSQAHPGKPYVAVAPWPSLNNSGDRIGLAMGGLEVEAVEYDGSWGLAGVSLERIDPKGPSWHPINWGPSRDPSGGTPGAQNSVLNPDTTPPALIFADRLHPDTVLAVFSEPVQGLEPAHVPEATQLIRLSDAAFALTGVSGPMVSERGVTDLFGNRSPGSMVTVTRPPGAAELIISERLVRPLADPSDGVPDQVPFLELFNAAPEAVSLRSLRLLGPHRDDTLQESALLPFLPVALEPGAAALVARSASDEPGLPDGTPLFVVDSGLLTKELLYLVGHDGTRLDSSRYRSDWHDPQVEERGTSLVRVDEDGWTPTAWASSPGGPNPGLHVFPVRRRAPVAGDVVISEVLFHAGEEGVEFVELQVLNAVDLNGIWLAVDRSPAKPDSARVVFRPFPAVSGDVVVAVRALSGIAIGDMAHVAQQVLLAADTSAGGAWIPIRGLSALRNTGVSIALHAASGLQLDRVDLDPSMHHPGLASHAGVSLERADAYGPAAEPTNWRSATDPHGSTPGWVPERKPPTDPATFLTTDARVFDPTEGPLTVGIAAPNAGTARVEIWDRSGFLVRTLTGLTGPGASVYWDGLNEAGRPVPPGLYVVLATGPAGTRAKAPIVVARRR